MTQEYVLSWSPDNGQSFKEIVRQQWNFRPPSTISGIEDHHVGLHGVNILESEIIGLTPEAALVAAAEHYLQLQRFSAEQILERRLRAVTATAEEPGSQGETEKRGRQG